LDASGQKLLFATYLGSDRMFALTAKSSDAAATPGRGDEEHTEAPFKAHLLIV